MSRVGVMWNSVTEQSIILLATRVIAGRTWFTITNEKLLMLALPIYVSHAHSRVYKNAHESAINAFGRI